MDTFNLDGVDRILVGGQWVHIERGTLRQAAGVAFRRRGEIHPAYLFRAVDGVEAMVLVDAVDGYAPISIVPDQPTPGSSMSPVSAMGGVLPPRPDDGEDPGPHQGPGPRFSAMRGASGG